MCVCMCVFRNGVKKEMLGKCREMKVRIEMIPTEYSSQFFISGFINFYPMNCFRGRERYCGSVEFFFMWKFDSHNIWNRANEVLICLYV